MRYFMRILGGAVVLGAAFLICSGEAAHADRFPRPASEVRTIFPAQTLVFDIAFQGGRPAVVMVSGNKATPLQVVMSDSDGHFAVADGFGDQKTVRMNVYRGGMFKVEVSNQGAVNNTFTIRTN